MACHASNWRGAKVNRQPLRGIRQRLRQGAGHGPEHGFARGVAEIGRGEVEHTLVDDVDDVAIGTRRQLRREVAREEGRRLGMDGEMRVPQRLIEIGGGIDEDRKGRFLETFSNGGEPIIGRLAAFAGKT